MPSGFHYLHMMAWTFPSYTEGGRKEEHDLLHFTKCKLCLKEEKTEQRGK